MSQQIANISLVGATVGQTGSIPATGVLPTPPGTALQQMRPDVGNLPTVVVFNESPCSLKIALPNSNQSITLPPGRWVPIPIPATETQLQYTVQSAPTGTFIYSNLLADYYHPGEPVEDLGVLGNSPVSGGAVTTTTTQQLYANDLVHYLDGFYDSIQQIYHLRPDSATPPLVQGMALDYTDGTGLHHTGILLGTVGQVSIMKAIVELNGIIAAAGTFGVPFLPGATIRQQITATTLTTVLTYTPASTGIFRLSGYVFVNNGTSGNMLTGRVNFNDPDAGSAANLNLIADASTGIVVMNGANSFANGRYPLHSYPFPATGGTAITVSYQDPTNTPSDFVTLILEQVA